MKVIDRLMLAAAGMHIADQTALVAVPLVAALAFGATAETIGVLVACQSMAHLLGSIPCGVVVDRLEPRRVALAAILISAVAATGASASILADNLVGFAVAVTLAGFGIVLFVLVALSIVPRIATGSQLAAANARIEVPRAAASFAVPLLVGLLMTAANAPLLFAGTALCALGTLIAAYGLPRLPAAAAPREPVLAGLLEGGRLVLRHELLRPISLCAIFWNLAFAGLVVVAVPVAVEVWRAEAGIFGIAMAAFGLASTAGSLVLGRFAGAIPPNVILLFGPGSTALAALGLLLVPPHGAPVVVYGLFFFVGFGPSMWLITQNSVRQLVTPGEMLGRVNAVIQTAIYGIRPIGAVLAGLVADATSPWIALACVALAFAASFAAALFSRLRTVRRYAELQPAEI